MSREIIQAICGVAKETMWALRAHQYDAKAFASDKDLLTTADIQADTTMQYRLPSLVDCPYVSEESIGDFSPSMWIVDPLDGTANYIARNGPWAVSIALVSDWQVLAGVVCTFEYTFHTQDNNLLISEQNDLSASRIWTDWTKRPCDEDVCHLLCKLRQHTLYPRIGGCCSVALTLVATGKLDGYICLAPEVFDFAAGAAIVERAGGMVTDVHGKPWSIHSKSIVAANELIHDDLLALLGG